MLYQNMSRKLACHRIKKKNVVYDIYFQFIHRFNTKNKYNFVVHYINSGSIYNIVQYIIAMIFRRSDQHDV